MKHTKQVLLSLSVNAFFYLPLFADSVGVSKSAFISGMLLGEYQVIKVDKGYVLLHFGRFVPEWNPLIERKELIDTLFSYK